jgi:hypothetical protein
MAGSFADYFEDWVLDRVLGSVAFTISAQWVGLFTVAPTDVSDSGTEVSASNGYARLEIEAATGRIWTTSSGGAISNSADWSFAAASGGNWGTVLAMAIMDDITQGSDNYLLWADLTVSKAVNDGDTAKFATNDLDVTLS